LHRLGLPVPQLLGRPAGRADGADDQLLQEPRHRRRPALRGRLRAGSDVGGLASARLTPALAARVPRAARKAADTIPRMPPPPDFDPDSTPSLSALPRRP